MSEGKPEDVEQDPKDMSTWELKEKLEELAEQVSPLFENRIFVTFIETAASRLANGSDGRSVTFGPYFRRLSGVGADRRRRHVRFARWL